MKSIYNPDKNILEEQPEMKEPDVKDFGRAYRIPYEAYLKRYTEQKARCKTYPVSGTVPEYWLKGEVLEEGFDYKIGFEKSRTQSTGGNLYNEIPGAETIKYFAIPLKENKKEEVSKPFPPIHFPEKEGMIYPEKEVNECEILELKSQLREQIAGAAMNEQSLLELNRKIKENLIDKVIEKCDEKIEYIKKGGEELPSYNKGRLKTYEEMKQYLQNLY